MASLREVIRLTHRVLDSSGIPDARLEAEVLVMDLMAMRRHDIFANQEAEVGAQREQELDRKVERRLKREPLAYILGHWEFYGIDLLVTPAVLIPRPETETLVEHALFMALMGMETPQLAIADVGTGSGAIAISMAIHLPAARIHALDSSGGALEVASYNVRAHNVADRVALGKGDLLGPLPDPVDLIVANLPYLPSERIATLQPEIQWEPREALEGGPDGLDPIKRLLSQAAGKLKDQGIILLELDPEQVPAVEELVHRYLPGSATSVEQDLARLDRIFVITRGGGKC